MSPTRRITTRKSRKSSPKPWFQYKTMRLGKDGLVDDRVVYQGRRSSLLMHILLREKKLTPAIKARRRALMRKIWALRRSMGAVTSKGSGKNEEPVPAADFEAEEHVVPGNLLPPTQFAGPRIELVAQYELPAEQRGRSSSGLPRAMVQREFPATPANLYISLDRDESASGTAVVPRVENFLRPRLNRRDTIPLPSVEDSEQEVFDVAPSYTSKDLVPPYYEEVEESDEEFDDSDEVQGLGLIGIPITTTETVHQRSTEGLGLILF